MDGNRLGRVHGRSTMDGPFRQGSTAACRRFRVSRRRQHRHAQRAAGPQESVMSKWIFRNEDGERVVVDLTDEEAAAVRAAQAEQDEDDEDEGADDDVGDEDDGEAARAADTPAEFARVEAVYRKE